MKDLVNRQVEPDPFQQLYNENSKINHDLRVAILNRLDIITKKKKEKKIYCGLCELIRMASE